MVQQDLVKSKLPMAVQEALTLIEEKEQLMSRYEIEWCPRVPLWMV